MTDQPATLDTVKAAIAARGVDNLAEFIASLIVPLGAKLEWSMEDNFGTTEAVADFAGVAGLPVAGGQDDDALRFWATIARDEGYEYDEEAFDDDEE